MKIIKQVRKLKNIYISKNTDYLKSLHKKRKNNIKNVFFKKIK